MIKKRFPITDYLEVVLTENDKTAIYINGHHFIQCSHVLTTVHTDEIENVLLLESIDDIKESPKTIVIDPETRFFVHCSNLQAWVENNFNTRMLHSNLSFSLLKKLVEEGCVSSMILKEEIAKRFEHGSVEMIRFLFEHEYLDSLSKEDLSAIITPNFKELIHVLTGSVSKEDHQLLNYLLERSLNEELKSILKEELAEGLGRGDLDMIRFLVDHGHLDSLSLSKEDLSEIIPPNFYLLLKDLLRGRKQDLQLISYLLERSLNEDLKTMVKEALAKILEKESLETLYFFYRRGYLEYISKERLSAIITPKFKKLLKDVFRDRVSDRAILGYLLGKSLNEWLKTMVKEEITEIFDHGDSKKIDILIKYNYLDFLSIEELSAIITPNLSKIVKMDINFEKYLFLLKKEELSTVLTQDILHNASKKILKSLPFEFKTVMKELIRRNFRLYKKYYFTDLNSLYDFDSVFKELRKLKTAPDREELLIIIKEEVSKMLKEDSSAGFLNFLFSSNGGYFNLLNKDEKLAILTQDILQKIPLKSVDFLLEHMYLYEDKDLITIVKKELANGFKQWDSYRFLILIEHGYLAYLSKKDISEIIIPNSKAIVKELSVGFEWWNPHHFRIFRFLLEYGYLDSFWKEEFMFKDFGFLSIEEASAIIAPNLKGPVEDLFSGDVSISSDVYILNYILGSEAGNFVYWSSDLKQLLFKIVKEVTKELIFYNLSLTLLKRYEVMDETTKKEIRTYFNALLDVRHLGNSVDQDKEKFKKMLGSKTLKDMLKTLSIRDILHLRCDEIIDERMYKEEVTRRFKSRNSDLRNLNDPNIVKELKNTWFKEYSDLSELWYEIFFVRDKITFSKSELLRMLPKKFQKIKNIITKLELNFEIEPHFPCEPVDHLYDQSFLFSVNPTEDLVEIEIQGYPDLSKNLDWIFSEIGKIKGVQYSIELLNTDVSALPTSIPNVPIIELIIDNDVIIEKK